MSFLNHIFGNTKTPVPAQTVPPGFNGGGLTGSFANNAYSVSADPTRSAAIGALGDTYGALGNATGDLRSTVTPGYNDLLKARLASYNNDASSALGTLAQNLQSRRVLGSSFGQDTLTRANNQFAMGRDQITADNFLKSLDANNKLLTQQYNAYAQQHQTALDELNLEAGLATKLQAGAADILKQNASLTQGANEFNAKVSGDQLAGLGKFVGSLALAPFTGGLSLGTMAMPGFGDSSGNPGSIAFGSNPFTPSGGRNPAYG